MEKRKVSSGRSGKLKISTHQEVGPAVHPEGNGAEFGQTGNFSPWDDVSWPEYLGTTMQAAERANDRLAVIIAKRRELVDPMDTGVPKGLYVVFPRSMTDPLDTTAVLKRELYQAQINLDASSELIGRIRLNKRDPSKPGSPEWDGLESSDNKLIGVGIGHLRSFGFSSQRFMSVWRVGPKTLELCCKKHRGHIVDSHGLATFIGHDCECGKGCCPGKTILPGAQGGMWFKQLDRYVTAIESEEEAATKRARTDTVPEAAETTTSAGAASSSAWAPATETETHYNPLSGSDEEGTN